MDSFQNPLRPEDVGALIDLTVEGDPNTRSMADLQLRGIAAIYNILCRQSFAYLADEVGMGKTYQAMGLAAVVWNEKPDARLLFLSPRENLQQKWSQDYRRFFASNYRRAQGLGDDRVASVLFGTPVHEPRRFDNLRSWIPTLGRRERIAPFLRHTSFMRPVFVVKSELEDLGALRALTARRLRSWGLFDARLPDNLTRENASHELNLAFAEALNARLASESGGGPYFDLVVVDEAQCLRHPENQTNQVLFRCLRGQVARWLFMSATPAHGGPGDLPTILNRYPDSGTVIDEECARDLPRLQNALEPFMVRRQRRYRTAASEVGKSEYRAHVSEDWGVRDRDMTALGTLTMGLVQKGLVKVLQGRSNRYRIGFLSSFESLQSSINRTLPESLGRDQAGDEAKGDWHHDQTGGRPEAEAPDTGFIDDISRDFEQRFKHPLPHPKVDALVDRVAPLAFGTDSEVGGHKFLIFTRRVSTVKALTDRLTRRHLAAIEDRIQRCWGRALDWSGEAQAIAASDGEEDELDDPEDFDADAEENPLRRAMSRNGWLYRYRQTFRASGRNACFLEDAWLRRLCLAGGVEPEKAAEALPDELWAESWTHASRAAGKRKQQYRADRMRYLAVQAIRRYPEAFGLDEQRAAPWRSAYEAALHEHLKPADQDANPHHDHELVTQHTLWSAWDERFRGTSLALPADRPDRVKPNDRDPLCKRQVARTLLGQALRLTDALLDLYYADEAAKGEAGRFAAGFLGWLASDDPGALQLRNDCEQWLKHLKLIVDSCLGGAGRGWPELARRESWEQLYNPRPVMGITGGSGDHRSAIRQFRTPSLPRVIVCTDTLKEGVDLHLFCDRVLHYGVAWTSGDLEQRVGRVDRFFSQIERRLGAASAEADVKLHVGYPHVAASLEAGQVARVIERQRLAERLMDSPLAGAHQEEKELVIDATAPRAKAPGYGPFQEHDFPDTGRIIVAVSQREARGVADHYTAWYQKLRDAFREQGWPLSPDDAKPARRATLEGTERQHELAWSFDAALGRYILTVSDPPWPEDCELALGRRRRSGGRRQKTERFLRLLVPSPDEGEGLDAIARLVATLRGQVPPADPHAKNSWEQALEGVATSARWLDESRAEAVISRGDRAHRITLRVLSGSISLVGQVASLPELEDRDEWQGAPTPDKLKEWALQATSSLALGYLQANAQGDLLFGAHLLHARLSADARSRIVEEVAWRADTWEAALTGLDIR